MSGYTKLFSSIVTSSVWSEDDRTRIVWITLLAMADQHGEVEASVPGLAKIASVPVADLEAALGRLSSPDAYSRTKDHEGRRIEAIDGGWRILNHAKYRARASAEDRREKDRLRKQRSRGGPTPSEPVRTASAPVRESPDKQTQTQTQTQKENKEGAAPFFDLIPQSLRVPEFLKAWSAWKDERDKHKKPLTPQAAVLHLETLVALGPAGAVKSIKRSIRSGWKDVFPPSDKRPQQEPHKFIPGAGNL